MVIKDFLTKCYPQTVFFINFVMFCFSRQTATNNDPTKQNKNNPEVSGHFVPGKFQINKKNTELGKKPIVEPTIDLETKKPTHLKFNIGPGNRPSQKGKDRLPTIIFQERAVQLQAYIT